MNDHLAAQLSNQSVQASTELQNEVSLPITELIPVQPHQSPQPYNKKKESRKLYLRCQPYAETIKIVLQMSIGIILVLLLLLKALSLLGIPVLSALANKNPLEIVSYALFFASGIELAYMLFTPGPDEAVEPLITGLAAAILLGVSNITTFRIEDGVTLLLAVIALAGLFAIKKTFFKKKTPDGQSKEENKA